MNRCRAIVQFALNRRVALAMGDPVDIIKNHLSQVTRTTDFVKPYLDKRG